MTEGVEVKIDLTKTLMRRSNARRAANDVDLPPHIRAMYRKAASHFDVVLGIAGAQERRAAGNLDGLRAQASGEQPEPETDLLGMPEQTALAEIMRLGGLTTPEAAALDEVGLRPSAPSPPAAAPTVQPAAAPCDGPRRESAGVWRTALAWSVILVVVGLVGWGMLAASEQYTAWQAANARARLGESCTDWWHDSRVAKLIAGPELAAVCRAYFTSRTDLEAEHDAVYWRDEVEDAQHEWELWRRRHPTDAAPEGGIE